MDPIKLTVVIDNNSNRTDAPSEHGLCIHIHSSGQTMLFDAGKSELVVNNLKALGLANPPPTWIALSHGHYDHTTGVPALLKLYPNAMLNFHPRLLEAKWILDNQKDWRYGGIPSAFHELDKVYLRPKRCSMELIPGVFTSGSIMGDNAKSYTDGRFYRNSGGHIQSDAFPDEQVLCVRSSKGITIISGCMHTGIENTVRKVNELFPREPIYAIIGGLHLGEKSNIEFKEFLDFVISIGVQKIMPLHCSGGPFSDYIKQHNPEMWLEGMVGSTFEF